MSAMVALEIPREVLHSARMSRHDLLVELAISLFGQGKLSLGKACQMTGMHLLAFQHVLAARGIPVHYGVEDYESDLETLEHLGRI